MKAIIKSNLKKLATGLVSIVIKVIAYVVTSVIFGWLFYINLRSIITDLTFGACMKFTLFVIICVWLVIWVRYLERDFYKNDK